MNQNLEESQAYALWLKDRGLSLGYRIRSQEIKVDQDIDILIVGVSLNQGPEGELLQKMLQAIGYHEKRSFHLDLGKEPEKLKGMLARLAQDAPILVFGQDVVSRLLPHEAKSSMAFNWHTAEDHQFKFLALPALADLLAFPELKRPSWEALKGLSS